MRLSKGMIKHIAEATAANLDAKKIAAFRKARDEVSARIAEIITENMIAEDNLDREVEKMLSAHEDEISKGGMDYRKVFELTKQKLARERGMVL